MCDSDCSLAMHDTANVENCMKLQWTMLTMELKFAAHVLAV